MIISFEVHVDNIERLVEDLPKYLEIELVDRIHFDAYYDCTEEFRNGAPVYVSDQGWEAYLDGIHDLMSQKISLFFSG